MRTTVKTIWWIILVSLTLLMVFTTRVAADRAIPDDNLAYPVLISLKSCTAAQGFRASGFFLNTGSATFLVTARHVLFNESSPARPLLCKEAELQSSSRNPNEKEQNRFVLDLEALSKAGKIKAHSRHDVTVVQIGSISQTEGQESVTTLPGVQILQSAPSGVLGVGIENVKKFDQVLTANEIYVFGYPTSIGIHEIPQIDYTKPLIRKGIIAGTNEAKRTLILDCLTFHGNSGGPVLEVEQESFTTKRLRIIGVISEFIPVTETWLNRTLNYTNLQIYNSGYSVAAPMDAVLELIN